MYTLPAKPEPIGVVLDDAIELYRSSFRFCWPISLVGMVLITGFQLRAYSGLPDVTFTGQSARQIFTDIGQSFIHMNRGGSFAFLNTLLVLLIELVIYGALFAQMHHVAVHGQGRSTLDALVIGLRRMPGMLAAAIIWTVAIGVGMALLLVPGIYLWGKLEFWIAAGFVDDVGSIGGLGRSWEMTRGNWWRSVTGVSVALLLMAVLGTATQVVAALSLTVVSDLTTLLLVAQLLQGIASIFVLPMLPAAALAIYYDMKLRRDGEDLLLRAKSLQTA
jgi:hypothetical protein